MRYFITKHQHKANEIDLALTNAGWFYKRRQVDIALFDHAISKPNSNIGRSIIRKYFDQGAYILTYPHGATGAWWTDTEGYFIDRHVSANLVIGEGHKYVQEIIQPDSSNYVIGWSYCPIKEFSKKDKITKILFAPIHASENNKLRSEAVDVNSRVYDALLKVFNLYDITIRHLNPLGDIGLHHNSNFKYIYGKPDGSYNDIDNADLVIAEGTYMYLSIARGKPTIGLNQHIPISSNHSKHSKLKNWDKYGEYMAYPIDFDDGDLRDLIYKASTNEQTEWKKLFIGHQMDGNNLVNLLTKLRNDYK